MAHSLVTTKRPSTSQLLSLLLDSPDLVAQVPTLPPAVLTKVIEHVGLEDAGELVALATTEQIVEVFDQDLWRRCEPGEDERFDAERFLVWLEVMLEAGDKFVADLLVELPSDLVTLALHKQVVVLDIDALFEKMSASEEDDVEAAEKALGDCLSEEIDGYQVISRHHDGWDNVLALLLALDRDHHEELVRLLERLCRLDAASIERHGGLQPFLSSEEMLEGDVAAEREDRRAARGHVAPSSARAFLKLARTDGAEPVRDPLTVAWFRSLETPSDTMRARPGVVGTRRDLTRWLTEVGVVADGGAHHLLGGGSEETPRKDREPLVVAALRQLASDAPAKFAERSNELAYLANVLGAGCSYRGRAMRPIEGVRAAIATTSLGLALAGGLPHVTLRDRSADVLFQLAWRQLQREVVVPAGEAATSLLSASSPAAAKRLSSFLAAGTPWKSLADLDALLENVEPTVVETLGGLLDECPSLRDGGRSDAEPRWLESPDDLATARAFLRSLGDSSFRARG